jgi:phosphoribosylformimino-5-aminoimidazole carboxamide ribotide isomerase
MDVIPAIDLRGGRCVRLLYGDFDAETVYDQDPVELAALYSGSGCRHLHVVDLDGARDGEPANAALIRRMTERTGLAVQTGGGIRTEAHVRTLLDHGVARVVIGSLAITDANRVTDWLRRFGPDRIVLALDVRTAGLAFPTITTHGWTESSGTSLYDCIDAYSAAGLKHVLCTDVDRDGALGGPALDLYRDTLRRYPDLKLQASGGVASVDDLAALRAAGLPAAITGKALLEGRITLEELTLFSRNA